MSLFPAYSTNSRKNVDSTNSRKNVDTLPSTIVPPAVAIVQWLENSSFALTEEQIKRIQCQQNAPTEDLIHSSATFSSDEEKRKKIHKRKKKKHKREKPIPVATPDIALEFRNEEFYVDKTPTPQYRTIRTLQKPGCPRYHKHFLRRLGSHFENNTIARNQRYYRQVKGTLLATSVIEPLEENEYTLLLGKLNRKIMETPTELQPWLDIIQLQQRNPYKWSDLLLAESKIEVVQRALGHHPGCEQLYRIYIETVNMIYPSTEVSKLLDRMLAKDPYNYTLWTAQIMTTQGSMSRCVVPDVLRIYERCMQKMHHAHKKSMETSTASGSDEIMIKLFNNCALFLRQSGLYEQFFALIKLAVELNVSPDQFGEFLPLDSDQRTLVEYEEVILQSGLPMNELWLRVEKLRQCFNFLPCPISAECDDPQRLVFNEDICHYVYPLNLQDNSFYLLLLILRLLKVPFVHCDGLAEKFCARVEDIGDSDAIEDVLAACLQITFTLPQQQHTDFLETLFGLAKEMAVSPTFLNNNIGYEIYCRCLTDFLMNCAATYAGIDERKRVVFLLLWCRLERVLLVLQKCSKKLNAEYVKAGRGRFKAILKQEPNRNVLNLYTEFAIYEYESMERPNENLDVISKIFENIIAANAAGATLSSDLCHIYVVFAEILIGTGFREEALNTLVAYALSVDLHEKSNISVAKKLAALQKVTEKLEAVLNVERNVEIMVIEQYLLPDYTISLLKVRVWLQCLLGQKLEAIAYLDKLLKIFLREHSDRHNFLRERIQELYISVLKLQLPNQNCVLSSSLVNIKLFAALNEYPRNLFFLQCCAMLIAAPWYKIRAAMLRNHPTILSVISLIAAARCRFIHNCKSMTMEVATVPDDIVACDEKHAESVVRNRIVNMFQLLTFSHKVQKPKMKQQEQKVYNALHRNALFWRFYLRCLSDQTTAFETSKKCLLTALDECPWNKALYMEGAVYVPQETTRLQDLMIEKQLRVYSLPEELDILRNKETN